MIKTLKYEATTKGRSLTAFHTSYENNIHMLSFIILHDKSHPKVFKTGRSLCINVIMANNAQCYFENGIFHYRIVKSLMSDIVHFCHQKNSLSVMDVGCGSGRLLIEEVFPLISENVAELVGVDESQPMIDHCTTLSTDPRVSFEKLDITTKELPDKFVNKFDVITSFFCLHYALDYDQAILNMSKMLKPNGYMVYVHPYQLNPLYETYKILCESDRWKHYLQDFKNYSTPFFGSDREKKLEEMFRSNDLKLLKYCFVDKEHNMIPKRFEASIQSLDSIEFHIPEDEKEEYKKNFHEIFGQVMGFDQVEGTNLEREFEYHSGFLTVHAQKL